MRPRCIFLVGLILLVSCTTVSCTTADRQPSMEEADADVGSAEDAEKDSTTTRDTSPGVDARPQRADSPWSEWQPAPVEPVGRTVELLIPLDSSTTAVALRARWDDSAQPLCAWPEPVTFTSDDGEETAAWVPELDDLYDGPVCTDCAERVMWTRPAGLFVLPNVGATVPLTGEVRLQWTLRDCAIGLRADAPFGDELPEAIEWQWRRVEAMEPEPAALSLQLVHAHAPGERADWPDGVDTGELRRQVEARFAAADIAVEWAPAIEVVRGERTLDVGLPDPDGGLSQLIDSSQRARGAVPVVLAPCVRLLEADAHTGSSATGVHGQVVHIPGDPDAPAPIEAVYLSVASCFRSGEPADWLSGADAASEQTIRAAALLAHEVGHFLGVHHADRPAGEHLVDDSASNVMRARPFEADDVAGLTFTTHQAEVMRTHLRAIKMDGLTER